MLNLSAATRVFIALAPVDLRGSFNRLSARAQNQLAQDPLSGHLFVFTNRLRNRLKILFWDGSGLWVCAKRLERGRTLRIAPKVLLPGEGVYRGSEGYVVPEVGLPWPEWIKR